MSALFGRSKNFLLFFARNSGPLQSGAPDFVHPAHPIATPPPLHSPCSAYCAGKKGKGSPYSIAERRVPEMIPVLGSQPAGDVSHKPDGRLPLLPARPAVTPATLKRAATNFAAW